MLSNSHENLLPALANRESHELTASIAHEINQPLTAITMYAQACIKMLQSTSVDQPRLLQALQKLSLQSLHAGAIVERIQRSLSGETNRREWINPNCLLTDLTQQVTEDGYELDAVVLGADFGSQLQTMFENDLARSDRVALEAWQHRSWRLRVQEWIARLWEYWL